MLFVAAYATRQGGWGGVKRPGSDYRFAGVVLLLQPETHVGIATVFGQADKVCAAVESVGLWDPRRAASLGRCQRYGCPLPGT